MQDEVEHVVHRVEAVRFARSRGARVRHTRCVLREALEERRLARVPFEAVEVQERRAAPRRSSTTANVAAAN